ncbi:tRNA (N6-isopentenyl adenosine(37)-C2)-methylthiotransferase MiaB [Halothermothrix orenii]|uniref:tRNA-2-methylthio-N(6)-dimethylallyladenosine synthase n=1 Tax=Halothermothrix orenii (strain H 168 / OCM 544 / DSM 9562) TaxID=373903 RepID=B8CX99_HALOH|nr:RNA modification enzyme, MiaB family [Halothermothrix orenii H 168]
MNNRKYFILTYGCQMNVHDSEKLAGMLEEMGYKSTNNLEEADIIMVNTCAVRENAELRVFGRVGDFKRLKEKNPDLIIGVGGCMMQIDENARKLYEKYPHVDLIFGTHNIHHIPELIKRIKEERGRIIEVWNQEEGLIPDIPYKREDDFKAWISIIQGCNNFCTYCIVPYVRGRERSRPAADIISEARKLASEGVKEITLLGQNVNSYGKDLKEDIDFADLLKRLNRVEGIKRIRYMTSHPRDFSDKMIKIIKECDKVCEHFHLPVQSGSTRILKKMNRGYTQAEYLNLIKKIKSQIPDYSITTDIIVGFPGETEEDFQETLKVIREVRFDMAYTFKYSPRKGTPAARHKDQVSEKIKQDRLTRLIEVQNSISLENNRKLKGKTVEVLIEGESRNNPDTFEGRTRTNKLVIVPRNENLKGQIANVKINRVGSWTLYGEVIDNTRETVLNT